MPLVRLDVKSLPDSPWKNGGGHTRVLATWPEGAGLESFDARVSIARIEQPGPFSAFPGVDRQIALLEGAGVRLRAQAGAADADDGFDHWLDEPLTPFAFAGEAEVDCTLLGGASRDFNLMLRRGRIKGQLLVVRAVETLHASPSGLVFAATGGWSLVRAGEPTLLLAQGEAALWRDTPGAAPIELHPAAGDVPASDAALLAIRLEPLA